MPKNKIFMPILHHGSKKSFVDPFVPWKKKLILNQYSLSASIKKVLKLFFMLRRK
jgi:hypothetical protein